MSYFLCGRVRMGPAGPSIGDCVWHFARAAAEFDLYLLIGPNVTQGNVLEVVRELEGSGGDFVPFLLTASPLCDTSHELLGFEVGGDPWSRARESMRRVAEWARRVRPLVGAGVLEIITLEGYDVDIPTRSATAETLTREFESELLAQGRLPSLRVVVLLDPNSSVPE